MNNSGNKIIHIDYYAVLREERGMERESITTDAETALDLYNKLQVQHNFSLGKDFLKVSINDTFLPWQTKIKDEDCIVFIPPVSGG